MMVPLAIGMAIQRASAPVASRIEPIVKKMTGIDTLLMLLLCVVVYGKGFIGAVGSYAIGTQIMFFTVATSRLVLLQLRADPGAEERVGLGMSTRNLGAAFAPLFAVPSVDQRAIVMVAIGVPMQTIFSLLAARWFARRASAGA